MDIKHDGVLEFGKGLSGVWCVDGLQLERRPQIVEVGVPIVYESCEGKIVVYWAKKRVCF